MRDHLVRARRVLPSVLFAAALCACAGSTSTAPATQSGGGASTAPTALATAAASRPATPIPIATGTPLGDRLVATVVVAPAPCAMAVDDASAWVTGSSTAELDRIDPKTNTVSDRFTLEGAPCGIALGVDGRIWVAELATGSVVAVDRATGKVTGRLDHVGPQLWDLKSGFGAIWVADRTARAVLRIDPKNASIVARIPSGPQPSGLAVMPAGVWISDDTDGKLRRIDPATNTVARTIEARGTPSWFADDGATHLVISERGAGVVQAVDPSTGDLGDPIAGWNQPLDGTVVGGAAWIPDGGGRSVGVVDLAAMGSAVVRYALPGAVNPFVAEPGFGDLWVLDFGGTTIWRIRP